MCHPGLRLFFINKVDPYHLRHSMFRSFIIHIPAKLPCTCNLNMKAHFNFRIKYRFVPLKTFHVGICRSMFHGFSCTTSNSIFYCYHCDESDTNLQPWVGCILTLKCNSKLGLVRCLFSAGWGEFPAPSCIKMTNKEICKCRKNVIFTPSVESWVLVYLSHRKTDIF